MAESISILVEQEVFLWSTVTGICG